MRFACVSVAALLLSACGQKTASMNDSARKDVHSFAAPEDVRVRHMDLDLTVDFASKTLRGSATHTLKRTNAAASLKLDTRDLKVTRAEVSHNGRDWMEAKFELAAPDKFLGSALTVPLAPDTTLVRVHYETSPGASGLQWLDPAQTAGRKHPFLFTQSQAIHARSWIPIQDTPGVRITYTARVRGPKELLAVMSAENETDAARDGDYSFRMRRPIPSYLVALAVGDLEFRAMSPRTGIYAEPPLAAAAAKEFADTEKMMQAAETLYGEYQWDRYDILVLPPSFPFGGMENPRVTFATPTIIAGDKSLVSLVAHELAHSWSGNLVTNATWRDFWLNEGFTVYLERRIQEQVFGRARSEMEGVLEVQELEEEMKGLQPRDQILHVNLDGRDPDDGFTQVPYVKGALFLRRLEEILGRERFDQFLRGYFAKFQFQSITTADFLAYLKAAEPGIEGKVDLEEWIEKPGLPPSTPRPKSDAFAKVEAAAARWLKGEATLKDLPSKEWTTQEWLHFLRALPPEAAAKRMADLDAAFVLTKSGNSEIASQWLLMSIRSRYEPAYPRLEQFLTSVGRRKFLKPLYEELVKTPEGKKRAQAIFAKAKSGYHPIAASAMESIVSR
ncbi:MAG: M1 family metallopeptidase [Bryobacteraceae bacterium]|nr:M1 family metallopeptidase [Bryobacteraceae bacterium]